MSTYPPAILFDLDDTILDYGAAVNYAWQVTCEQYGPGIGIHDTDSFAQAIYTKADWYWSDSERHRRGRLDLVAARREILTAVLTDMGIDNPTAASEMAELRSRLHEEGMCLFPGALDTLTALRNAGVGMGMITNGAEDAQTRKIERFNLRPLFDVILIEGAYGVGKPDPRVYQHVLQQLDAKPQHAWMVGDNLVWDVEAPQRLGIYGIWNDVRNQGLPAQAAVKPDRIIRSIAELIATAPITA